MDQCSQCNAKTGRLVDGLCQACQTSFGETVQPESTPAPDATHLSDLSAASSIDVATTGEVFGDYELLEEVARGGMGVIYKARHTKLNRIAALKMILSGRFSSQEELQRFYVEAEAAASLDHPGIVPFYEIGDVDGQSFFAMKYVEGGSLAAQLDQVRPTPREAALMLSQVAQAVHHAHQRGILHRDLKPANILLDVDGRPLITDLGLAKKTRSESNLTNTGAVMGTPSYMPPEQASGKTSVTTTADIYALGAILYELLTGQPPYRGDSAVDTVLKVLEGPPPTPRQVDPGVDPSLELICLKCMERDPEDRYQSALAFSADLDAWLDGSPISVNPPTVAERMSQWFRNNSRLAYSLFAVCAGMSLTFPFFMEFLTNQSYVHIYDTYPHFERPWLFKMGRAPEGMGYLSLFLIAGFGSSIGFLTAMVAAPRSFWRAIGVGTLTSVVLYVTFLIFMGWMPILLNLDSSIRIHKMAAAIWPEDETKTQEERRQLAEDAFPGLDEVPVAERAEVVMALMEGNRLAQAPETLVTMTIIASVIALPIILSTAMGWWLLGRNRKVWLAFVRYQVLYWTLPNGLLFACNAVAGLIKEPFFGPPSGRFGPGFSSVVACVVLSFSYLATLGQSRKKQRGR